MGDFKHETSTTDTISNHICIDTIATTFIYIGYVYVAYKKATGSTQKNFSSFRGWARFRLSK